MQLDLPIAHTVATGLSCGASARFGSGFRHEPATFTTKQRIVVSAGRRRARLSTNRLGLAGFGSGTRIRISRHGASGFSISPAKDTEAGFTVSSRSYQSGRRETVLELSNAEAVGPALLNPAFDELRYCVSAGRIVVEPVLNHGFHIRRTFQTSAIQNALFVGMSSGIDAACAQAAGFDPHWLWEWRPPERRDGPRDLSDSGVKTALANCPFRVVFNEDVFGGQEGVHALLHTVVPHVVGKDCPPVALMMLSPQCDDFSPLKGKAQRARDVDSLQTTMDMVHPVLNLVDLIRPVSLLVENVPGFGDSASGRILAIGLRRLGYHVSTTVLNAPDFGDLTSRRRFFLVASYFPGFRFPAPSGPNTTPLGEILRNELPSFREATNTSSFRQSEACGRRRAFDSTSTVAPTIVKSQARQPKDATVYVHNDPSTGQVRGFYPSLAGLQRLQGIPASFDFSAVSQEVAIEQIGQSVSWGLHHRLVEAIAAHHRHVLAMGCP